MKKHFLLPALLLLGFTTAVTSCKKKKDEDAVNPAIQECMVDHSRSADDSVQVTYDSDSRIIKDQTFDNSGNSKGYSLYTYASNQIIKKKYNDNGDLSSETRYYLNSNNHASYSVFIEDGDVSNADTTWYVYDGGNRNVRRVTKNTSTIIAITSVKYDTTWYTYSGENLAKIEEKTDGGDIQTTIFSYGTHDAKSKFLVPGQDSGIMGLYGTISSKLPISATSGSTTHAFHYKYNAEGYVTRYQIINSGTIEQDIRYVYNCK